MTNQPIRKQNRKAQVIAWGVFVGLPLFFMVGTLIERSQHMEFCARTSNAGTYSQCLGAYEQLNP